MIVASNLPRCRYGDNDCIPRAVNTWLKLLKEGNKEVNLPPINPLYVDKVNIIQDPNSNIAIKLSLRDAYVYGLDKAEIYKTIGFEADPLKSKYEVHAKIPKIVIKSKYIVDGKVLILPITGNGDAVLSFGNFFSFFLHQYVNCTQINLLLFYTENTDVKLKLKMETYEKNGETHVKITKFKLNFVIGKFQVRLENLFNGKCTSFYHLNSFYFICFHVHRQQSIR